MICIALRPALVTALKNYIPVCRFNLFTMLSGDVAVGIAGVLATICVALPGLFIFAWRWRRSAGKSWFGRQQTEYVSGTSMAAFFFSFHFCFCFVSFFLSSFLLFYIPPYPSSNDMLILFPLSDSEETALVPHASSPPLPISQLGHGIMYAEINLPRASLRLQTMRMIEMTFMEYPSANRVVRDRTGN